MSAYDISIGSTYGISTESGGSIESPWHCVCEFVGINPVPEFSDFSLNNLTTGFPVTEFSNNWFLRVAPRIYRTQTHKHNVRDSQ